MQRLHMDCHWHPPAGIHIGCLHFGKQQKVVFSGEDTVRKLSEEVEQLEVTNHGAAEPSKEKKQAILHKLSEDVQKQLHQILELMKDLAEETKEEKAGKHHTPAKGTETIDMLEQFLAADLPVQLLSQLDSLEFEARKEVMNVCCALLWPDMPDKVDRQVLDYFIDHTRAFPLLIEAYEHEELALHCGVVFRSCMRHKELVAAFLKTDLVMELIRYSQSQIIDISTDAFFSLREVLLEHKDVAAEWLEKHSQKFFEQFTHLMESEHYVLQRQALTLLCEVLLSRHFQSIMIQYVSNEKNLQIIMTLLTNSSKVIQAEAFQVFKIFVANPDKPTRVNQILFKNREKLANLVATIPPLRAADRQFMNDRQSVIDRLNQLLPPLQRNQSSISPSRSGIQSPRSPTSPKSVQSKAAPENVTLA